MAGNRRRVVVTGLGGDFAPGLRCSAFVEIAAGGPERHAVISNSLGFGGHNLTLAFAKLKL